MRGGSNRRMHCRQSHSDPMVLHRALAAHATSHMKLLDPNLWPFRTPCEQRQQRGACQHHVRALRCCHLELDSPALTGALQLGGDVESRVDADRHHHDAAASQDAETEGPARSARSGSRGGARPPARQRIFMSPFSAFLGFLGRAPWPEQNATSGRLSLHSGLSLSVDSVPPSDYFGRKSA